jgi:hypothetical protein
MTETVTLPSGIKYVDHVVGTGEWGKGQKIRFLT